MSVENLKNNIYWIGVKDPELRVFDIIMETKKGTTYNSYIIDDEKVAIVDVCKDGFYEKYRNNIKEVIGDKKVDYIIVQHTELDHSGSLKYLLEDYSDATVVGTKAALSYLKNIVNKPFKSLEAREDINLGKVTLKFITAPNLHWPDTMFTYVENEKFLFTCDFTGCHYCPKDKMVDTFGDDYLEEMKYYFDCIMGPFKRFVNMGLDKIKDLDIEMIATSHGPVHSGETVNKYLNLYREWAKEEDVNPKRVEILYITAYGNTGVMAEYIKGRLEDAGYEVGVNDITEIGIDEAVSRIEKAKGFMIGSPTINQDAVKPSWDLLSLVNPIVNRGKATMAFGSFGWSGEGVRMLTERLKSLKLKTVEPGVAFNFVPSEEEFKKADEAVEKFISLL